MTLPKLTPRGPGARKRTMKGCKRLVIFGPVCGLAMLGGCINVNAPSEPIVIELNINIRQEVIYRLAADVEDNIDANPDIF